MQVYDLKMETIPPVEEIGGKAHGLMEAAGYGFPVPDGLVLPVAFFDSWDRVIHTWLEWEHFVQGPTPAVCAALQAKVRELTFDKEQLLALSPHWEEVERYGLLAVRSSAPDEDREDISFAGLYHTSLRVTREELESAVATTVSSQYDYRVAAYRLKNGLKPMNARMAVILQRLLDASVSGVGFSLNPENNCYDEMILNAVAGTAEALVGGAVTPDSYMVEKNKKRVLRTIAPNGKDNALLEDESVLEVATMLNQCEETFGGPVDIEWSFEDEELYLLQVRPITTYFPLFEEMLTEPGEPRILYVDVMQTSQGIKKQLSVLGLDLYAKGMDEIMAQGIMPSGEGGYLLNLHGKQYFHVSNMLRGMGKNLAIQTVGEQDFVVRQLKERIAARYTSARKTPAMKAARKVMTKAALRDLPRFAGVFLNPLRQLERYNEMADSMLVQIGQLHKEGSIQETVGRGFALLKPITEQAATFVPGQLALVRIKRMFKGKGLDEDITALDIALPSNPTTEMTRKLVEMARSAELMDLSDPEEFARRYREREFSDSLLRKIDAYLLRFGGRGFYEIDVATERCAGKPSLLFRKLMEVPLEDNALSQAELRKAEAVRRLEVEAAKKGRTKTFHRNLERYEKLFGLREMPKYMIAMLLGRLHGIVIQMGRDWYREGRLDRPEQIFDLHLTQIAQAERQPDLALRPLIENNLEAYRRMERVRYWPITFDSRGRIIAHMPEIAEGGYKGQSISPGVVRGFAKVLKEPFEKPLQAGEILVTHAVEPAWTVLFLKASGVVLEVGGILQHGAIIAREFGLPCVSGLRKATALIHDGDLIEVDGNSGLVRILERTEVGIE